VTCVTRENFSRRLARAVARCDDPEAGRELRASVLRFYQAPGDVWAYTAEDLQRTADIVLQHVRAASVRRPAAALSFVMDGAADPASA